MCDSEFPRFWSHDIIRTATRKKSVKQFLEALKIYGQVTKKKLRLWPFQIVEKGRNLRI